jgi:hypothetical protein
MPLHTHEFVETYSGLVGFGLDRQTDENTIVYYLQKFSDDRLMAQMSRRMNDDELSTLFNLLSGLLRKHLSEEEYHALFLKDDH